LYAVIKTEVTVCLGHT